MNDLRTLSTLALAGLSIGIHAQNLLRNGDFEAIPGPNVGQGILPSEWIVVIASPDTYSNDGSYGLPPNGFGNFPSVVAHSGLRWVAGWSGVPEVFGQVLTAPLVAGRRYRLRAFLHQAVRVDLNSPGTYEVTLRQTGLPNRVLGRFDNTVSVSEGWVPRSFDFVAPADAGAYSTLAFDPKANPSFFSYPGMDSVSLVAEGATSVSVHVDLQDYLASPATVSAVIEVRNLGSTSPLETHQVALDASGNGSFQTNLSGSYDLAAKASHWLRHTVPNVALGSGASFVLMNGDVDDDNEVAIGDYALLSVAFGSEPGDPNWNSDADLNGDDGVDIGDFSILSQNFGEAGDD
ncbi:MAG TPA: hypothetical protein PLL78_02945 [Fimbriimonadaceae bacterium]|nr:hypothetical protein [Fimbriimonadaceae bacterium]HRJ95618.1 hypothetical protein [Fimbriimonadaceae bacterium]